MNKNYSSRKENRTTVNIVTMSSVKTKMARHPKEEKKMNKSERKQLMETDGKKAMASAKDISAVIMKNFESCMGMQNLAFKAVCRTLKEDLEKILEVKNIMPEVESSTNSSSKEESQDIQKAELMEKIEGENSELNEDIENFGFKRKKDLHSKLNKTKEYTGNQSKISQNESENSKVLENMEKASGLKDDRRRNDNIHKEVPEKESRKNGEDEPAKEMGEEKHFQSLSNKGKTVKASREETLSMEEGALLTLAADFSSATLEVGKQWGDIFKILTENDFEPRFVCEVKLAFKCDDEIKTFSDLQSLRKFTSQKPSMKELLKDVLPQNEKPNHRGRRYGIQEKVGQTLMDSKHEAGGTASDGLSFLFIKEVKVARPEVKSLETGEEESSERKEKEHPEVEEQEASGMEEEDSEENEEETSEEEEEEENEEEGEDSSEEEEEGSEENGEETSEEEEEEEDSEENEEEGEETSEKEEEGGDTSVLLEQQDPNFQGLTVVDTKHEVEVTRDDVEVIVVDFILDSESEEEEQEGESSEIRKVVTISQTEKKESSYGLKEFAFSYMVWDSEKKRLVKRHVVHKTQEEKEIAMLKSPGIGACRLTLHLTSASKPLELSYDQHIKNSLADLSDPSEVTKFFQTKEKARNKTLQIAALTSKEEDLIQETEENFRRSVISSFREIQKELLYLRNNHPDVLEINHSIDNLYNTMDMLESKIYSLDDQMEEFSKDTLPMARQIINKERIRDREDRFRSSNIRLIGIPEKDDKENEAEDIVNEIIEENFPELRKDSSLEIVSAQRIPSMIDKSRPTPRHILVKFWNSSDKKKVLKASKERKEITYRGRRVRLTADLSLGTLDARSQWSKIIKVLQEEGFQPRILYPAKLAFDFEGKTKIFFDIEEFRKFVSYVPSLRELLPNIF